MKIMKIFCYENLEPYNILENPAAQEAICKKWACAACIVASTTLILLCDLNLHVKNLRITEKLKYYKGYY